jgi:hypothetical protein
MKTSIFTTSTIILLIGLTAFANRIQWKKNDNPFQQIEYSEINSDNKKQCASLSFVITNTIEYEGEIIPLVYLPELKVEVEAPVKYLVQTKVYNGEEILFVTLPEITIEG